jgi:hypothetical protein
MMARIRFIAKILISMLVPASFAIALSRVWSALHPDVGITHNESRADIAVGVLIFGLLLLSVVLPILLAIREIQNKYVRQPPSISGVIESSTNTLWK